MTDKKQKELVLTPEGRLINSSLFEKDKFDEKSTAQYKVEMAFEEGDALDDFEEKLANAAADKWGDKAFDEYYDELIKSPLIDGNRMAKKREAKGKPGDAYKGKVILRSHTIYNKHGADGPGGIMVYDEDVTEVEGATQQAIYNGCYGQAAVVIEGYVNNEGERALVCYLNAFQKTRDGERLVSQRDYSTVFKPVGRERGSGEPRRRRRD